MQKNRKISGQGTLEWILILAVIVGFVMMFGTTIKNRISATTGKLFDSVDKNVTNL